MRLGLSLIGNRDSRELSISRGWKGCIPQGRARSRAACCVAALRIRRVIAFVSLPVDIEHDERPSRPRQRVVVFGAPHGGKSHVQPGPMIERMRSSTSSMVQEAIRHRADCRYSNAGTQAGRLQCGKCGFEATYVIGEVVMRMRIRS